MGVVPRLTFDPDGLDPRVERALDEIVAPLQTWFDKQTLNFSGALTGGQPRCRYFLPSVQTITTATDTAISWSDLGQKFDINDVVISSVHYDNGAEFGDGQKFLRAAGAYLTPPIPGQYLVIASASFANHATGRRDLWLQQREPGGATFDLAGARTDTTASLALLQVSHVMTVREPTATAGRDQIRVMVYQDSGGDLNVTAGFLGTTVQIIKVS